MAKWTVRVEWEIEVECADEGEALLEADREFSFMSEACAEEIEPEDGEEEEDDAD